MNGIALATLRRERISEGERHGTKLGVRIRGTRARGLGATAPNQAKERFNQLGRLGWELVSVSVSPLTASPVAVFKRPKN